MTPPPQPQPPAFTPKRTLPRARSYAEFTAALSHLQPGDRLPCSGVVLPGFCHIARKLTAPAEIVFDSTCKASPGTHTYAPSIWLNVANLRLIANGMRISNPKVGGGIGIGGLQHSVIDGFEVYDCGAGAMGATPTDAPVDDFYIRGVVHDWGLVPSLDTHSEKGTGLHGLLVEDSHTPYKVGHGTIVLTTSGSKIGGSLLEIGTSSTNSAFAPAYMKVWLQAANLLQDAKIQTAGNALNLWGYDGAIDVLWIGATGLHGYALHSSPYGTYTGPVTVDAGSATNCCLNPRYRGQSPWMKQGGVQYPNPAAVSPRP